MGWDTTARRRWLGALALIAALAMVIAEETLLKARLSVPGSLVYWLVCLVLTGIAMFAALRDLRALRRQGREKQRDLLQETLQNIQRDAKARHRRGSADGQAR